MNIYLTNHNVRYRIMLQRSLIGEMLLLISLLISSHGGVTGQSLFST